MSTKDTKRLQIMPKGRKIFQMVVKFSIPRHSQILPKTGISGLKTNHLATLLGSEPGFF
jgi:hypothetical protein